MQARRSGAQGPSLLLIVSALCLVSTLVLLGPRPVNAEAGLALQFDGNNDYVSLGDSGDLFGGHGWTAAKTISAWVRPTGSDSPVMPPTSGQMIISADRPRTFGISRAVYQGADRLWIWNIDANGLDALGIDFTLNEWTHVALVHDGQTLSAYRNGQLVGSVASGPTAATVRNDGSLYLAGSGRNDPSLYFAGELDEVRFWTEALEAPVIAAWHDRQLDSRHPGWPHLRAYYLMSDGTGTSLSDDSPFDHTGMLLGGMGTASWIDSGAPIDDSFLPATATTTAAPPTAAPTASNTPLATATATSPPVATATATSLPTATPTPVTPTATPLPPPPTSTTTPHNELMEVAAVDTPGFAYTVRVVDNRAFLADVTGGLRIYDVSNPAAPVELGFYLAPRRVYGVAVAGRYAYAAATESGVRVVDVSNPAQPEEVASFASGGFVWSVTVHDRMAYVGDRNGTLHIVDVVDPLHPVTMSTIALGGEVLGAAIAGNYAYVAAYQAGLKIVDVSNPAAPVIAGSLSSASAYDLQLVGSHVFLADGGSGLRIVDVSNPAQPVLVGSYNTSGWSRSVFARGDLAYVGDWTSGVTIVNVGSYSAPALAGSLTMPGKPRDVWVDGSYLYVAAYEGGLRIYDIGP